MNLKNSIGKTPIRRIEKGTLRCGEALMGTNNIKIITQHPIYNIRKLILHYRGQQHSSPILSESWYTYESLDITKRVKEKADFDTLKNKSADDFTAVNPDEYKIFNLSFSIGGNEIDGFGNSYGDFWTGTAWTITNVIEAVKNPDAQGNVVPIFDSSYHTYVINDIREILFEIEYDSVDENAIHVGRYLPLARTGVNRLFDNQETSYCDLKHQSFFEYSKINRLSNKILQVTGTYFDPTDIPQLGDQIGDYILFQREIQYCDDQINFVGYLTPNYILRDWFTGLNSKRRSWQIVSGNEASLRNDVYKFYLELSFSRKEDVIDELEQYSDLTIANLIEGLIGSLAGHSGYDAIKYALVQTIDKNGEIIQNNGGYYVVELFKELEGKSICFNFGFDDNFYAGSYIEKDSSKYIETNYKYADKNGNFKEVDIVLASKFDFSNEGSNLDIQKPFNSYVLPSL